ncbi:pilin [Patescibacteria group bacterium]|nr:pilin [Patescibacteria group bacterium]
MTEKIKKFLNFLWPVALFCAVLLVFFKTAHAQGALGGAWDQFLRNDLKSFGGAPGESGEDVAVSVIKRLISIVKYVMGGAALIFGILYATNLIFSRGKEETISKQKTNFLWIFVGFVVLMLAEQVANIFNPEQSTSENLIDFEAGRDKLRDITDYLKWLFGSIIVLLMTISGIRLVTAGGDQETIDKQKRNLTWSGIGMLMILMASGIVNAIYVVEEGTVAETTESLTQISGVIRLLLVFLGPVAILFTISAGFMYLTAFENEERAKTAKNMIIGGVTGIIFIYAAYALVNTFFSPADLLPPQA